MRALPARGCWKEAQGTVSGGPGKSLSLMSKLTSLRKDLLVSHWGKREEGGATAQVFWKLRQEDHMFKPTWGKDQNTD